MALTAYLIVVGKKQGDIHGSATTKGHENTSLVLSFDDAVSSPYDTASGQASGKRQHQPLTIVKAIDRSSPLLLTALTTNESLLSVELEFWETAADGKDTQIYAITLTNAIIVSISQTLSDPASADTALREHVSFTYQKIQWTWLDGGITSQDDWQAAT